MRSSMVRALHRASWKLPSYLWMRIRWRSAAYRCRSCSTRLTWCQPAPCRATWYRLRASCLRILNQHRPQPLEPLRLSVR